MGQLFVSGRNRTMGAICNRKGPQPRTLGWLGTVQHLGRVPRKARFYSLSAAAAELGVCCAPSTMYLFSIGIMPFGMGEELHTTLCRRKAPPWSSIPKSNPRLKRYFAAFSHYIAPPTLVSSTAT
jgi:hypothetical protein